MSMDSPTVTAPTASKFANRTIIAPLGPVARYHLKNALLMTAVPLVCGVVLMLLMSVFAKLNLYYLEANGLIINDEIRDAYYSQVQGETMGVAGFLFLQLAVTAVVSVVVMRWASAPFLNATRTLETAISHPDQLKPRNRWLSESAFFDRIVWLFALRVKNGGENQIKEGNSTFSANLLFLIKFFITFAVLSIITGSLMGAIIEQVYVKIVNLALELLRAKSLSSSIHFFSAQQEILRDATTITTGVSLVVYFLIGLKISRYMTTMIYVFSRALEEDRFPIQLRTYDVYHSLGAVMNKAREKIR